MSSAIGTREFEVAVSGDRLVRISIDGPLQQESGFEDILFIPGFKGFKDEAGMLRPALQKIYESKSLLGRGVVRLLTPALGPWAGHSVLLVFKR